MVKKYYCEHCEKTFPDAQRKKHLAGQTHQLKVKQHYDRFRDRPQAVALSDLKPILIPESKGRFNIPTLRKGKAPVTGSAHREKIPDGSGILLSTGPRTTAWYLLNIFPKGTTKKKLPPSLRPPPSRGYDWNKTAEWG